MQTRFTPQSRGMACASAGARTEGEAGVWLAASKNAEALGNVRRVARKLALPEFAAMFLAGGHLASPRPRGRFALDLDDAGDGRDLPIRGREARRLAQLAGALLPAQRRELGFDDVACVVILRVLIFLV